MRSTKIIPTTQALLSAVLFGASAPLAKLLLGEIQPIPLAAFLYLGSGIGLFLFWLVRRHSSHFNNEAMLSKLDLPWLIASTATGGILAPIVLMFSLKNVPGSTASLLLNFEGVATTFIAWMVFREAVSRKVWLSVASILAACILLTWDPNGQWGFSLGALGVVLACFLWGADNNFTRNISSKDPVLIVTIKGAVAGLFSLSCAVILGNALPSVFTAFGAMLIGFICYGISIVLFIYAMRNMGASRTSAFFGTAPFIGSFISIFIFNEAPGLLFYVSASLMVAGVYLLTSESHEHSHTHDCLTHEHRHNHHDEHHIHEHSPQKELEHSHFHMHAKTKHSHPHMPDLHHWHTHDEKC